MSIDTTLLFQFFRRRGVSQFRGLAKYTENSIDIDYAQDTPSENVLVEFYETCSHRNTGDTVLATDSSDLTTDLHASMHYFDKGLLIHFPIENRRGIIAVFDPSVAPHSHEFIEHCVNLYTQSQNDE